MSIYYPGDESLSKTIVSEKVTLIKRRLFMNWVSFFGGMIVAILVIGLGVGLWVLGDKKTFAVQSWGHLILGATLAVVAVYLGFQLITVGGFLAWCWKLPVIVVAAMAAIIFCDVGINGDQPPR